MRNIVYHLWDMVACKQLQPMAMCHLCNQLTTMHVCLWEASVDSSCGLRVPCARHHALPASPKFVAVMYQLVNVYLQHLL